jgi:hypothetical protein
MDGARPDLGQRIEKGIAVFSPAFDVKGRHRAFKLKDQ